MSLLPSRFFFDDDFLEDFMKIDKNFGSMKCDIYKDEDKYHIEVDVPGFDKKDISIECEDGYLTIEAEKSKESKDENKNYVRRERVFGKTKRQFYLGNVDEENIKAAFESGVLKIEIPILEVKDTKKKIEIE